MKLDLKITKATIFLLFLVVTTPVFSAFHIPVLSNVLLNAVELFQAIWLVWGALFTVCWIRNNRPDKRTTIFWSWSVLWWLTLAGRSTSWGRVYFPQGPHWLFTLISVLLIGSLILPLFFSEMRQAIAEQWRKTTLPVMPFFIVIIAFLFSDAIEHHRAISGFIMYDAKYQDITEEFFEIPFMTGLFYVAFSLMRNERYTLNCSLLINEARS